MRTLLRSRHSPIRVVEETIAAVCEELAFTLNYVAAMLDQGNGRAAVEVIDEQRRSLARRAAAAEAAMAPPRRRRAAVVAIGLAAAMLFGSGAFAGWRISRPPVAAGDTQAVRLASEALRTAIATEDPQELRELVGGAQETILALAQQAATDPAVRATLSSLLAAQETLLRVNPNVPADVARRAAEVEKVVREEVAKADAPVEENAPKPEEPKAERPAPDQQATEQSAPEEPAAPAAPDDASSPGAR